MQKDQKISPVILSGLVSAVVLLLIGILFALITR